MSGLLILILIFIGIPLLWRWMKPFFYGWMQRRTEDYIRNAMGMPPRDKQRGTRQKTGFGRFGRESGRSAGRERHTPSGPLIPKEYAVDVEFTEIHSYSDERVISGDGKRVSFRTESQVSDAEIIEIRRDR